MKAIIIDDEVGSREYLKKALDSRCPDITILGMGKNIREGYDLIQNTEPDLVFLDIEMPNGTGFDLLRRFDKIKFDVVFVTGFDQYALNAIKFNCLDYLLKPCSFSEVAEAVEKAMEKRKNDRVSISMDNFLYNLQATNSEQKVALPTSEGLEFIKVGNITYLEADGKYTRFFFMEGKPLFISKNIKEYESIFEEFGFFRCHRKYIVNLDRVKRYCKGEGGSVVMSENTVLPISRRRKEVFMERFKNKFTI